MVVQNPFDMGYQAVRLLKAMIESDDTTIAEMFPDRGQPNGDLYDTGLKVVVSDANSPLAPEAFSAFGERTSFMTLSEFQSWLGQYNLKGS
jgi:ribose transport system substrate-binding protein